MTKEEIFIVAFGLVGDCQSHRVFRALRDFSWDEMVARYKDARSRFPGGRRAEATSFIEAMVEHGFIREEHVVDLCICDDLTGYEKLFTEAEKYARALLEKERR